MVAYDDIPKVNTLHQEQAGLTNGIAMIDAGGTVASFTVAPPAPPPPEPGMPPTMPPPMMMMMSVSIATIAPAPELMASARSAMVARSNAISSELAALGVTEAPPAAR